MGIYCNCREIPIHNFFELSRTGKVKFLFKNYNDLEDIEETEELSSIRINIISEYNDLFKEKRNDGLVSKAELLSLKIRLDNLLQIQSIFLSSGPSPELENLCKKIDVNINDIEIHIKTLRSQINKLEKRLEIESESVENDTDSMEKTLSLVKENGFNFDRFSTPIIEYVYAINRLEEKSQYYQSLAKNKC